MKTGPHLLEVLEPIIKHCLTEVVYVRAAACLARLLYVMLYLVAFVRYLLNSSTTQSQAFLTPVPPPRSDDMIHLK